MQSAMSWISWDAPASAWGVQCAAPNTSLCSTLEQGNLIGHRSDLWRHADGTATDEQLWVRLTAALP